MTTHHVIAQRVTAYKGTRLVAIACPICGLEHIHGMPLSEPDDAVLHRVSHCPAIRKRGTDRVTHPSGDYFISVPFGLSAAARAQIEGTP